MYDSKIVFEKQNCGNKFQLQLYIKLDETEKSSNKHWNTPHPLTHSIPENSAKKS